MSGDVQPRKRKDKKRKKDELGIEEPRGTSAVFGEGDVFMHSQHNHGTGGHWCAKIIFFSLLAVLVALIGLIILENRGLTELEANAVESRYSGVLDGWIEETPGDDHHNEHTLELRQRDDEDDNEEDEEEEIGRIKREVSEEVIISSELPALPEQDDVTEKEIGEDDSEQEDIEEEFLNSDDDFDVPIVEQITVPAGKPFVEVDEETSSEKPTSSVPDTLAEEEEYEKQQEELRREEEQASNVWLKLSVGAALLAATHVVIRRVYAAPDASVSEESSSNEKSSTAIDRRMTLIPEETSVPATPETEFTPELSNPIGSEDLKKSIEFIQNSLMVSKQNREDQSEMEIPLDLQNTQGKMSLNEIAQDQELYSDDDDDDIEEEEEKFFGKKQEANGEEIENKHDPSPAGEDMPDDVEIIDDEPLEEEIEEEEISDVDDAELLSRLEAKYGRLPEPERPTPKHSKHGPECRSSSIYFHISGGMFCY